MSLNQVDSYVAAVRCDASGQRTCTAFVPREKEESFIVFETGVIDMIFREHHVDLHNLRWTSHSDSRSHNADAARLSISLPELAKTLVG